MIEYVILIILALGFSYWAAKSQYFSWATMLFFIIGVLIALGGVMALISKFIFALVHLNLKMNSIYAIAIIIITSCFLAAWITDTKTLVYVPKNYVNKYLLIIYQVKEGKKIWPSLIGFPRTYKLKFPQSGIITTSEKPFGSGYYFSMCRVLEENGNLYLPNKSSRYFFSTSKIYKGFHIDILFLDDTCPTKNNLNFDFFDQLNLTKLK